MFRNVYVMKNYNANVALVFVNFPTYTPSYVERVHLSFFIEVTNTNYLPFYDHRDPAAFLYKNKNIIHMY